MIGMAYVRLLEMTQKKSKRNPYARIKARDIMEYLQQIGEITKAKENIDDTGMSKGTYTLKRKKNPLYLWRLEGP